MLIILRILKWSAVAVVTVALLFVGYVQLQVARHDTLNMPANHGKVSSELYLGNATKQPLIVGLGGSEGGNAWSSDRWKSEREHYLSRGYAFLAIGYFGAPGIPEKLDRIALEGVYAAIAEAAKNPRVDGRCIAVIGGSKGGELALTLASYYPQIKAVVAIVASHAVFAGITDAMTTSSFTYQGKELPFVPVPWSTTWAFLSGNMRRVTEIMLEDQAAVQQASIQVEKINGPIYLLSAADDEMWPSAEMSEQILQRLGKHNFKYPAEHRAVTGGHVAPLQHMNSVEVFLDKHFHPDTETGCVR